ncbi:hypothetical protein ACFP1Z_30745 [Streptomyces gamaensis]|uniref:Uncharacterized protein n=1 Tax=Streptomyces gamaensis TaxID=1763542 RepID=A0ABW0Z770_9ACTN
MTNRHRPNRGGGREANRSFSTWAVNCLIHPLQSTY